MPTVKIAPSFLTADLARLAEAVQAAEAAGADYIHLDIMDGHFVPPITFGSATVAAVRRITSLPLDVHLMIEQPERHLEAFAQAGSDILNVHVEACRHLHRVVQQIKGLGCRAGVCLNPATPVSAVEEILPEADQVMVMGVNPGWGGQPFILAVLPKIERLSVLIAERGLAAEIEVDGGVSPQTAPACVEAGARVLVAGSTLFNDRGSVAENMARLRESLVRAGLVV